MSNAYTRFKRIFPDPVVMVGTVLSVDNGVATVQDASGSTYLARGDVSVDDYVFFKAGAIEGPAPSLPLSIIAL